MRTLLSTLFGIVLVAIVAVHYFGHSDPAERADAAEQGGPTEVSGTDESEAPEVRRHPLVQSGDSAAQTMDERGRFLAALADCLHSAKPRECISGLDLASVHEWELAELLATPEYPWLARVELLRAYAMRLPAAEALGSFDMIYGLMEQCEDKRMLFESALAALKRDAPSWVERFGMSLTGPELFGTSSTPVGICLASYLSDVNPAVLGLLEDGARGEWGGDGEQMDMAFLRRSTLMLQDEPELYFEFAASVLQSPHIGLEDGYGIGQTALHYAGRYARKSAETAARAEQLLGLMMTDTRFALGAAVQFYYGGRQAFGFLSDSSYQLMMLDAEQTLVREYGESVLDR